jgi:hypothetical protein
VDLRVIRSTIVAAVGSDDVLEQTLVLKGGNALDLVHRLGFRGSVDLDFSMEDDLHDITQFSDRLLRALSDQFDLLGYDVFDYTFTPRPSTSGPGEPWGGYLAEFKLISKEMKLKLRGNLEDMRRQAHESGPQHSRKFRIDISKFEFCRGSATAEVRGWECRVYTPAMIAAEKLRAICQQMKEYAQRKHPAPRARDFYDIRAIVTLAGVDLTSQHDLEIVRGMFAAKEVPIELLDNLPAYRDFHRQDWPRVRNAVGGELLDFDTYFEFAIGLSQRVLQACRVMDAPAP